MSPPDRPAAPAPRLGLPLGRLAVVLAGASVALAGGIGHGLALWLELPEPWIAALAAALGVTLTAVPVGVLLFALARPGTPSLPSEAPTTPASGAMTRPQFIELAEREWARARRYGSEAALLVVEVDRFARLAESRGQAAAEAVMDELVHDTASTLRGADALARFGEGQLIVFLAQADPMGALDVAERIRERTEMLEVTGRPHPLRATVSVGVAHLRPAHLHLQALLDDAGDALLAARQAGGNCVRAAPIDADGVMPPAGRRNDQRTPKP
jgi:diguanylate cyclase (GGDEF)-like protein